MKYTKPLLIKINASSRGLCAVGSAAGPGGIDCSNGAAANGYRCTSGQNAPGTMCSDGIQALGLAECNPGATAAMAGGACITGDDPGDTF